MNASERAALAEQYADADNLNARVRLHEEHDTADRDWWQWVFDRVDLPDGARVLELGCGPGYLWRDVADRVPADASLLLTDFSRGMVTEARGTLAAAGIGNGGADCVEADFATAAAESLPVADDSVDAVVANHMLYHVDRDAALPEIRRVLRPGGRLYATTNGEDNLAELRGMITAVSDFVPPSATKFSLESGSEQLAAHFAGVERYERDSALRVPEVEPLVAYAGSLSAIEREELAAFTDHAAARLEDGDGPLRIEKSMGLFVARAP